jgi:hypothetical protein
MESFCKFKASKNCSSTKLNVITNFCIVLFVFLQINLLLYKPQSQMDASCIAEVEELCLNNLTYIIQIICLFVRFFLSNNQVKRLPRLCAMGGD